MAKKAGTGKRKGPALVRGFSLALKAGVFAGGAAAAFFLAKEDAKTRKISREDAEKLGALIQKQKAKEPGE